MTGAAEFSTIYTRAFRIGEWTVRPNVSRIERDGVGRGLEPKSMAVLVDLAEHQGQPRSKRRLLSVVWGDAFVTDDVLTHAIWELRKKLGDDAKEPRYIETLARKGYRLIAPVEGLSTGPAAWSDSSFHYEVGEQLGSGGMGVVHRAVDTRLGREIALKFLPPEVADDSARKERFLLEAQAAGAISHRNIAVVHDVGESPDGRMFIAMELVEGETLAERLQRGRLPVEEAVRLAIQIARGLEAAHERGLVHRDLKPANIRITPAGEAKVLDFGLARRTEAAPVTDPSASPPPSPTMPGVLLGTAGYMSPEQARGEVVDHRSDVWAFGVVLWEMLTGKRLVPGETATEALAETLLGEPDWEELPAGLPAGVRRVLRRCLVKAVGNRLHDIADARIELEEALEEPEADVGVGAVPRPWQRRWRRVLPWVAVLAIAALAWYLKPTPEPEPPPPVSFEVELPEGERLTHTHRHGIALSPDGSRLAFVSGTAADAVWPKRVQLHVRDLTQWESRPIPGTEFTGQPVFSSDAKWLAFVAIDPSRLRKVALDGGEPETICECDASYGASWGEDGTLVFGGFKIGGLWRVSAQGGSPEPLTVLDEEQGERRHSLPHHLPGGKALLLTVSMEGAGWIEGTSSVQLKNLVDGSRRLLVADAADARYSPTGHLVYAREGKLLAAPFDLDRLQVTGAEIPVVDGVVQANHMPSDGVDTMAAQFSLSGTGSLAYAVGSVFPSMPRSVMFVDRQGRAEPLDIQPRDFGTVRVSPDGGKLLVTDWYVGDAWVYDLERSTLSRQTFDTLTDFAIWGPGPGQITYRRGPQSPDVRRSAGLKGGPPGIFTKPVNVGPGRAKRSLLAEDGTPSSWTADGTTLAYVVNRFRVETPASDEAIDNVINDLDLWTYSEETGLRPFLQTPFNEGNPEFSPDDRWLAYTSIETGIPQVYVRPYPGPGSAVQVSPDGGTAPAWSRDGREIYYRWGGRFFAVSVEVRGDRLSPGLPQLLFEDVYTAGGPVRVWDVVGDGRFLMTTNPNEAVMQETVEKVFPTRIRVVQNWRPGSG